MKIKAKKIILACLPLLILALFLVPVIAAAQASLGLEVGADTGLGTADLKDLIVRVVQILLGFLGVIAVIVMLYGGYIWMTAGGNTDNITSAKKILINGIIGLVVILSAFAVVTYIINQMNEATGPPAGEICEPVGLIEACSNIGNCELERECFTPGYWGACYITNAPCDENFDPNSSFNPQSIQPQGNLYIKNVVVQVTFNKDVDVNSVINPPSNLPQSIKVLKDLGGNNYVETEGILELATDRIVTFTPTFGCPGYPGEYCFDENQLYKIVVSDNEFVSIQSTSGNTVNCSELGVVCEIEFTTGDLVDITAPDPVNLTQVIGNPTINLYNGVNLSADELYELYAHAEDDGGLTQINFYLEGGLMDSVNPAPPPPLSYDGFIDWSTNNYQTNQTYTLGATAYDAAFHQTSAPEIDVMIRLAECFNGQIDPGFPSYETGLDCGGECPVCEGESCSDDPLTCVPNNNACLSNLCDVNSCLCVPLPEITSIDPDNGAPGNWITILGQNFGDTEGEVWYTDPDNNLILAQLPNVTGCDGVWQDNQIIVEIPETASGVGLSSWYIITSEALTSNTYEDFILDPNAVYPGVCGIDPNEGLFESEFTVLGTQFGSGNDRSVYFGDESGQNLAANPVWSTFVDHDEVTANVPNLLAGQSPVRVEVLGESSNGIFYTILEEQAEPLNIDYFEPTEGSPDQYVTVYGSGFGATKTDTQTVRFLTSGSLGYEEGNFEFPAECGTNYWSNNQIIVKVPFIPDTEVIMGGAPIVVFKDGEQAISDENFVYDISLDVTPGICSINPEIGEPNVTVVEIAGEPFDGARVNFSNITGLPPEGSSGNNTIYITVPAGADSGQVTVENSGLESNSVNFEVIGVEPPPAVANPDFYEWQFTTCWNCFVPEVMENGSCTSGNASPLPLKYPWNGYDTAFIDQNLGVQFNVNMDDNSFIANSTVILEECGSGNTFGICNQVNWDFTPNFSIINPSITSPEYVTFDPIQNLAANTWYQITLTTGLTSIYINPVTLEEENVAMDQDYSWHFKTQGSDGLCSADQVSIYPPDRTQGSNMGPIPRYETVAYNSYGINGGNCAICADTFNWDWSSDHQPEAQVDSNNHSSSNSVYASGLVEEPDVAVISAVIADVPPNPIGEAQLNIVPPDPQIVMDYSCTNGSDRSPTPWPNEEGTCTNMMVSARFNMMMDAATLNTNNVGLFICDISGCNNQVPELDNQIVPNFVTEADFFIYTPSDPLDIDTWYEVRLTEDVLSIDGVPLTGLTSWQFKTKNDSTWCEIDSISVNPNLKDFELEEQYGYVANGYDSETCQLLIVPNNTTWNWSSELDLNTIPPYANTGMSIASVLPNFNVGGQGVTTVTAESPGVTYIRSYVEVDGNFIYNTGYNGQATVGTPLVLALDDYIPTGNNVCLNALARAEFNFGLDEISINENNFAVYDRNSQLINTLITNNNSRQVISLKPDNGNYLWIPNEEYTVVVKGGDMGIRSGEFNLNDEGCTANWNSVNETCNWTFTTINEMCEVDSVIINPTSTVTILEEEVTWEAVGYDEFGLALSDPVSSWSLTNEDIATLTENPPNNADTHSELSGSTWVEATISNITNGGQLIVEPEAIGPSITGTVPSNSAGSICRNSLISIDFDKYLDEQTVNNEIFTLSYHTDDIPVVNDTVLTFDGSNDYLTIDPAEATTLNMEDFDFMAEAWVKTSGGGQGIIFEKSGASGWWFGVNNSGRLHAELENNYQVNFTSQDSVTDDLWHHVVLIADRDGNAQFFIDGVGDNVHIINNLGSVSNNEDAGIGAFGVNSYAFNGSISSVRLYKFTSGIPVNIDYLIQKQYGHPLSVEGVLNPYLVARWEMNEGSGTDLYDSSNYSHTLTQIDSDKMPEWDTGQLPAEGSCDLIVYGNQNNNKGRSIFFRTFIARFVNDYILDLFDGLFDRFLNKTYASNQYNINVPTDGFWCPVSGYGDWSVSTISGTAQAKFQMTQALPALEIIRVKVLGGEDGVLGVNGLGLENPNTPEGDYEFIFGTSPDICELNFVVVAADQETGDNEWLFTSSHDDNSDNQYGNISYDLSNDFDKIYQVTGYSSTPANSQPLVSIPDVYEWDWQWSSEDTNIALTADCEVFEDYYPPCDTFINDTSAVLAANNNGETNITAQAIFPPWYEQETLSDSGIAKVELCENPWPSYDQNNELRYYDGNNKNVGYKFALSYCRDAGGFGTLDDLPTIYEGANLSQVNIDAWVVTTEGGVSAIDGIEDDLLKEYLIPVPTTDDIIGVRIYSNYYHLSPQNWYAKNIPTNQQGVLTSFTIDGYPAIQDGRTVYVAATKLNLNGADEVTQAYTNIFLISYNSGADQATIDIFNRIVERLEFNTNVSDNEFKIAINHDLQRMADLSDMEESLYEYNLNNQERIQNNDFEQGLTAWETENDPQVEVNIEPTKIKHGSKSIHVTADAGGEGIYQLLLLEPLTNYNISAWVYVESGRVHLTFYGDDHLDWYSPANFTGWIKLENVLQTEGSPNVPNGYSNSVYIRSHEGPAEFYVDSVILRSNYPGLAAGSFLPGMSTSKWPSWSQTLGPLLGGNSPVDPVNNFNGCVTCEYDLENGGFEDDYTGWAQMGNAFVDINTNQDYVKSGEQSLFIYATNGQVMAVRQEANLSENTVYNLSAWVFIEDGYAMLEYDNQTVQTPENYQGWYQLELAVDTYSSPVDEYVKIWALADIDHQFYVDDVVITSAQDPTCGYDPDTCWNPSANNEQGAFACDAASYFYRYQYQTDQVNNLTIGVPTYFLSAKMEIPYYDDVDEVWQPQNSGNYIFFNADNLRLSEDRVEGCDQTVVGQVCGNGVVEPPIEECEPGDHHDWCPFGYNWQTPQILGCDNNCQWIEPNGTYPDYCGGYCGDGFVITPEGCDPSAPIGSQGFGEGTSQTNQYDCDVACADFGGWCGNSIVDLAYGEECDGSNGLDAWDCESGNPACRAVNDPEQCQVYCPAGGQPYSGTCGNGTIEEGEECDGNNKPPNTDCSNNCQITGCETGWAACDGEMDDEDGCEINTASDAENCMGCANTGVGENCYDVLSFIANNSFESGAAGNNNPPDPWDNVWSITLEYNNNFEYIKDGDRSLKMSWSDTPGHGIDQQLYLQDNTVYNITAWVYMIDGQAEIKYGNTLSDITPENHNGWYQLHLLVDTNTMATNSNFMILTYSSSEDNTFYLDDINISPDANIENTIVACQLGCVYSCDPYSSYLNCDNPPADCESNYFTDPNNCGACGIECDYNIEEPNHTAISCQTGICAYSCIDYPWTNCDGNEGCESNLQTDPDDCGECDLECPEPDELPDSGLPDYGLTFSLPAEAGTASCDDFECSMDWHCERPGGPQNYGYLDKFVIEHEQDDFNITWPQVLTFGPGNNETDPFQLPSCDLSGSMMIDMEVNAAAGTVGIVFVSDRSGSMGSGAGSKMEMLKTAIAGNGNALDTLFATNPNAEVALISYGDSISFDTSAFGSGFAGIGDIATLESLVGGYQATLGGTYHDTALNAVQNLLDWSNYTTKIIIFMTDGGFSSGHDALSEANTFRGNGFDIFTVALTNSDTLIAYMNGISSKVEQLQTSCDCGGNICQDATNGTCGDGTTQCATQGYAQFEDCDGQVGCITSGIDQCQWDGNHDYYNRAYATLDPNELTDMYVAIAGAIPIDSMDIYFNNVLFGQVSPIINNFVNDYVIELPEGSYGIQCSNSPNNNNKIKILFSGNDQASITISEPRYYYCPVSHWPFIEDDSSYRGVY